MRDRPVVPRDEDIDGFAGQFLPAVAEHLLRPRVDEFDVPAFVEKDDRIRHMLEGLKGFREAPREIRRVAGLVRSVCMASLLAIRNPSHPYHSGRPGCGQKKSPAVRGVARRGHRSRDAPPVASGTELRIV